jgi:hypothetical protein
MPSIFRMAALAAVGLLPVPAGAEPASPVFLGIVHVGAVSAMTYYTTEEDGFRLVTTVQEDGRDAPVPVRFVTTLQAGQSTVISVPAEMGARAWALEFVRDGDRIVVHRPAEQGTAASERRPM